MEGFCSLFEDIRTCGGIYQKDGKNVCCWGAFTGCLRPVAVPVAGLPDVMVVTEQVNLWKKEWRENKPSIPKNMSEELIKSMVEVKRGRWRRGVIPRIDEVFSGRFLGDFDENRKCFNRFYWTHFIKCPGNVRKPVKEKEKEECEKLDENACADKFLVKEISVLRPKVIVAMGAYASKWILCKADYKGDWREKLWSEIEKVARGDTDIPESKIEGCDHRAKIIVLMHPSGANTWAKFINNKLKPLIEANCL